MYKTANPVIGSIDENGEYVLPRPLKKGDRVLIADLQQEAVIASEVNENSESVFVQMGIMKMKIQVSRLRLLDTSRTNQNQQNQRKKTPIRFRRKSSAKALWNWISGAIPVMKVFMKWSSLFPVPCLRISEQ